MQRYNHFSNKQIFFGFFCEIFYPDIYQCKKIGVLFVGTVLSTYICTHKINKAMRTTNFTDLRNNLKKYLDAVINDSDTVIINRDGDTGAVLISLDEYNAIKETEYIMASPAMMEAIREGERDIKEGRFVSQQDGESISDFLNRIA